MPHASPPAALILLQVVPPEASEVAGSWAAALQGAARQQALATHRKRLA
jgi:hypothetical protein